MTLEEVAETSGVSARAISDMERGHVAMVSHPDAAADLIRQAAAASVAS
jgi:transcriptional regulator with XRE-family HTH domain